MRSLEEARIDRNWGAFSRYLDKRLKGLPTGLEHLDKYLLGLGDFISIQGETASNKSTLALQIVHHNLKAGTHAVIMVDKENGEGRTRSRLLCQANQISEADLMVADKEARRAFRTKIVDFPLYIYTETVMDFEILRDRIDECIALHEKPVILFLDSVQALDPVNPDQRLSMEAWMYFLDRMKVEYAGKVVILIASEKNRASYGATGLGSSKGSNSGDFKPETILDMRALEDGSIRLYVAKHRDGIKGAAFALEKVLSDPANPRSFTFTLREEVVAI